MIGAPRLAGQALSRALLPLPLATLNLQPFLLPEAMHPLRIEDLALSSQDGPGATLAKAGPFLGNLAQTLQKSGLCWAPVRLVSGAGALESEQSAGASLRVPACG